MNFLLACLAIALTAPEPGSWPEPRGNAQLTAWQPVAGDMADAPEEWARIDTGRGWPTLRPVPLPNGEILGVALFGGATYAYTQEGKEAWYSHPAGLNFTTLHTVEDLDGDGQVELLYTAGRPTEPYCAVVMLNAATGAETWRYHVEPMSYSWTMHVGEFVPGAAGKQVVVMMHGYPPDPKNGYIALFRFGFHGVAPQLQWRREFDAYTCFPTLHQVDLDADGAKELAVQTHSRMWFLDAVTGEVKHFSAWDVAPANIRSYGLVKFTDLDKDGRDDFLCIANFAQHHEVLLNRDGKMEKAWHQGWAESVTTGNVATRYPPVPDVDVDGDGRTDLVLSMFNAEEKPEWVIRVYDAVSGELKHRVPGGFSVACVDLEGDGVFEILGNLSSDPTGSLISGARLWKLQGGQVAVAWEQENATALESTRAEVRVGETTHLLQSHADTGYTLALPEPAPKVAEPQFANVPPTVGKPMPTLLAASLDKAPGLELIAYVEPDVSTYSFGEALTTTPKKFQSTSIPVLAPIEGTETQALVLSSASATGPPTISAHALQQEPSLLWSAALPPATRAGLPAPRKAYLRTLPNSEGAAPGLYAWFGIPLARSLGMDGTTGALLWEKGEVPGIERYWAPSTNYAAAWDYNGDGAQDLVFTNPDYYCIADGRTGEALLGPLFPPDIFSQPSQGLYTYPAVLPRKDAPPLVCLANGHYFLACMTIDAKPLWHKLPAPGENRCAAEAFLQDQTGKWRIGFGRQDGRFACLDAESGAVLAELELGASATDAIAWDSDGDGSVEFVFGDSHGWLHRVSVGEDGALRDRPANLGRASLGTPIAADFDRDGKCKLAVPTADGYILLLK